MKMVIDRAIIEQVLEALEEYQSKGAPFLACDGAVAALRAALAQQDEPVLVQGELPPRYVARSPIQAEPGEKTCTYKCEAWPECGCAPPQHKN